MLDRGAPIPDDPHARRLSAAGRIHVLQTELEPDRAHARRDRVVHDGVEELAAAEDIDDVHADLCRDVDESVIRALAFDRRAAQERVDRNDPVTLRAEITRYR